MYVVLQEEESAISPEEGTDKAGGSRFAQGSDIKVAEQELVESVVYVKDGRHLCGEVGTERHIPVSTIYLINTCSI